MLLTAGCTRDSCDICLKYRGGEAFSRRCCSREQVRYAQADRCGAAMRVRDVVLHEDTFSFERYASREIHEVTVRDHNHVENLDRRCWRALWFLLKGEVLAAQRAVPIKWHWCPRCTAIIPSLNNWRRVTRRRKICSYDQNS